MVSVDLGGMPLELRFKVSLTVFFVTFGKAGLILSPSLRYDLEQAQAERAVLSHVSLAFYRRSGI